MGLPVIATSVGGPSELIEDGIDGILLRPREPERWAEVASSLLDDDPLRERIGAAARLKALRFGAERQRTAALAAYRAALGSRDGGPLLAEMAP